MYRPLRKSAEEWHLFWKICCQTLLYGIWWCHAGIIHCITGNPSVSEPHKNRSRMPELYKEQLYITAIVSSAEAAYLYLSQNLLKIPLIRFLLPLPLMNPTMISVTISKPCRKKECADKLCLFSSSSIKLIPKSQNSFMYHASM